MKVWSLALVCVLLVACASPDTDSTVADHQAPSAVNSTVSSIATSSLSAVDRLDNANVTTYSRNAQPPPDYRTYVEFIESVEMPDEAWNVVLGRRIGRSNELGVAFGCRQPRSESLDLVIASVPSDDTGVIIDVIMAYAAEAGCDPEGPGPPVACMGHDLDPVSCGEGEPNGG